MQHQAQDNQGFIKTVKTKEWKTYPQRPGREKQNKPKRRNKQWGF